MTFELGDRVTAVDVRDCGHPPQLEKGKAYTVSCVTQKLLNWEDTGEVNFIGLKEKDEKTGNWMVSRFTLASVSNWRGRMK